MQNNSWKLTSKVGTFIFSKKTPLSVAKLVRDTVMGEVLGVQSPNGHSKIHSEADAQEFIKNAQSHILANVKFRFEMA